MNPSFSFLIYLFNLFFKQFFLISNLEKFTVVKNSMLANTYITNLTQYNLSDLCISEIQHCGPANSEEVCKFVWMPGNHKGVCDSIEDPKTEAICDGLIGL